MAQPVPSFTGLLIHRDLRYQYSLFVPDGWHRLDTSASDTSGVLYVPSTDDTLTGLSIEASDLGTTVTTADLPAFKSGLLKGIRRLPQARIESSEAEAVGTLLTMEVRHTFHEGDAVRKRWIRLLYQGSTQLRLVAQGSTPEAFDYWLPMFFESMRTVRFGDWWFDVVGRGWAERVWEPAPPAIADGQAVTQE